jgi:hypothetical protein
VTVFWILISAAIVFSAVLAALPTDDRESDVPWREWDDVYGSEL